LLNKLVAFGLGSHDYIHSELTKVKVKLDLRDEESLLTVLLRFGPLRSIPASDTAKHWKQDIALQDIEDDLLAAAQKGKTSWMPVWRKGCCQLK